MQAQQTIVSDSFTGTNGTSITAHTPDIDLPVTSYVQGTGYGAPAPTLSTAAYASSSSSLSLDGDAYVELAITSKGTYTQPTGNVTLSANLEIGGITSDGQTQRGVFLGFAGTQTSGNVGGGTPIDGGGTFAGLILSPAGSLLLEKPGEGSTGQSVIGSFNSATLGTFSTGSFYKLSYSVNATTGVLSGITLSDSTGTQTFDAPSDDIFAGATTIVPNNLSVFGSSSAFTTGFVDDLTFTSTPEPATWLGAGLTLAVGASTLRRRADSGNGLVHAR